MNTFEKLKNAILKVLNSSSSLLDFAIRFYVASVFWQSGLTKTLDMTATLWLFSNEYHVPLLTPVMAAYLAIGVELIFSILLMIGLAGRFSAAILFAFNCMAVISYSGLQEQGMNWHIAWGLMLLVTLCYGPGKISADYAICKIAALRRGFKNESSYH